MNRRIAIPVVAAALVALAGSASAQVGGVSASPELTAPLNTGVSPSPLSSPSMGRSLSIAPTGIPMGGTELRTPGESPVMPGLPVNMNAHMLRDNASQGTSVGPAGIPLGAAGLPILGVSPPAAVGVGSLTIAAGGSEACSVTGASGSTALFSGGGMTGTTGVTGPSGSSGIPCPGAISSQESLSAERSGSVFYRATTKSGGIAMGATELQNSGLTRAPASAFSATTPLATSPLSSRSPFQQ
jgi:hypothetical protein